MGDTKGVPQIPPNANTKVVRPSVEINGNKIVVVGELHWWTRDFEIESVVVQYGKVKEIRFFDEWDSGKSKGYCKVEFYESAAASACKDGMDGHIFNGRACVVEFATPHNIRKMEASYIDSITQGQAQPQPQLQARSPVNEANYSRGDTGRNFGGSRGNRAPNRGRGTYGHGISGPSFGGPYGMMPPPPPPQGMYRGFSGRGGFRGMLPPPMGFPGVNRAYFGRGMNMNMNMRMGGAHSGMWNDRNMGGHGREGSDASEYGAHPGMWNAITNMGGWGGEELGRDSSYGGREYGEASHEKCVRSSAPGRQHREERERYDREYSRRRERYDRDSRRREEERDRYRDKGQSSRSRR